jgi:hypothetical protein
MIKTIQIIKAAAASEIKKLYNKLEKNPDYTCVTEIRGYWGFAVLHIQLNADKSTKRWLAIVTEGRYKNGRKIQTGPLVAV